MHSFKHFFLMNICPKVIYLTSYWDLKYWPLHLPLQRHSRSLGFNCPFQTTDCLHFPASRIHMKLTILCGLLLSNVISVFAHPIDNANYISTNDASVSSQRTIPNAQRESFVHMFNWKYSEIVSNPSLFY